MSVCLCADDIPLQRLAIPPVIIPIGPFWDELENFWSDLVNELPNIPDGGNEYFGAHLKPSLGNTACLCNVLCYDKLMLCIKCVHMTMRHDCIQ